MSLRKLLALAAALVLSASVCHAQINTDRMTQVGRNALYFEDYVLAIRYFNQVIAAKPYLAEPYYLRAIAKYSLDDYAGAELDASAAIERNPFLPDAWEVRGVARQCRGNHAGAVTDYSAGLRLLPHNRQMLFNKALAAEEAGMEAVADSAYAELTAMYPGYDAAYVGRAQTMLHRGDSIAARADLDKALELNPGSVQALVVRAALTQDSDPEAALADMEQAVRQQPDRTYLRVNRAVIRYKAGDFNGALADFDYVATLEPMNYTALFNRAILRAEMRDNDRALDDLNRLLEIRPDDLRARFNRAIVLADKRMYDEALADADAVVKAYPEMFAAYTLRAGIRQKAGREQAAAADYRRARALAYRPEPTPGGDSGETQGEEPATESEEATINRFKALLTLNDEADRIEQTFHTEGLHGRIQDHNVQIEPQPIYELSYYTADGGEGASSSVYVKEVADLNASGTLPFAVYVTNNLPTLTRQGDIDSHFADIQRIGALVNSGRDKPIDRFARAMDYMTIRDYQPAIADLDSVIARTPDFAPAYLLRAAARYHLQESRRGTMTEAVEAGTEQRLNAESAMALNSIMADLDAALEHTPQLAVAHYNRGTILLILGAYADAIDSFDRALAIDPTLGPAYFNRGFARFSQGNREAATADISRAGQLGVHAGYSLLKKMSEND